MRFGPQALLRAVAYAERNKRDFLTALPQIDPAGFLCDTVFAGRGFIGALSTRLWRLRDPDTPDVLGVGAFLKVLTAASQACLVAGSVLASAWTGRRLTAAVFFPPVALLLVAYLSLRSGLVGGRIGGITWRGVTYDAATLRDAQRFRL